MGLRIVRATIKLREDEFKKQDMGHLTKFTFRRIIIATKTVLYYLEFFLWPNRMGLYHEWGNHYHKEIEREDGRFLIGLTCIIGLIAIFFTTPLFIVKFGILWFFAFLFIFLNWITIQQFVTERYLFIPSIGLFLIVAYFLQDHQLIIVCIGSIYVTRTWLHLPTYDDELRFYLSNTWNYQASEIAFANLGCTYMRLGAVGSALDAWHASIRVNPDYDVPYANIYFYHKSNAMFDVEHGNYQNAIEKLKQAHQYIEGCTKCSICHFKNDWNRELDSVKQWLQNPLLLIVSEKKRLIDLQNTLKVRMAALPKGESPEGIISSLKDIDQRLQHIAELLSRVPPDQVPSAENAPETQIILPGK